MKQILLLGGAALFLLFACARQVTKQPGTVSSQPIQGPSAPSVTKKLKKDTLDYYIEFQDTAQRARFAHALEKLIKSFPVKVAADSSTFHYIKTQVVTGAPQPAMSLTPAAPPIPPEGRRDSVPSLASPPRYGGIVRIYTPEGVVGGALSALVQQRPFDTKSCAAGGGDSGCGYCTVKEATDRKITIALSSIAVNADGKPFSAFDVAAGWSAAIKTHPAEGGAIFHYVKGVEQFIAGREAIVTGIRIVDEKTVVLELARPDPFAVQRLCTSRLFPAAFRAGPYCISNEGNGMVHLTPNAHFPSGRPFLNSCEIRLGKDNNPFLSYSMNRYDAMVLFSTKDVDYARREFSGKSQLMGISEDRYFLALAIQLIDMRQFLNRLVDRKDILANFVKADGSVLSCIETDGDTIAGTASPALLAGAPAQAAPVIVLFRTGDAVSILIAEKLLADLSRAGIPCTMKRASDDEYEKALVSRDYGVAVGFMPKTVLTDHGERLRMATLWFNDETNERGRLDSLREIPLFSVKTYLLYKNKLAFQGDKLEGIFVKE
jgi:hypothetical protein